MKLINHIHYMFTYLSLISIISNNNIELFHNHCVEILLKADLNYFIVNHQTTLTI